MDRNNSLSRNTFLLTLGTFLNKGLQFLVIPFFSRWLTTEEYGEFDLLYAYVSLLIPVITLSTQEAMFRFCVDETDSRRKETYIANTCIIQSVNYLVAVLVLFLFRNRVGDTVYFAFCLYLFAELFSVFLRGYLRAIKKLNIYSISMSISTVFMAVFVTLFVYIMHLGIVGMLLGYAVGTLIGDMIICYLSRFYRMLPLGGIKLGRIRELVVYSAPLIPNDVAWWIMNASDRQIINIFFGSTANGIYAIAHKIPTLCSIIFGMFSVSWQQEVVGRIKEENRNEYFNSILNALLECLFTVCAGLLAGSFIIYYFILDSKYFDAILYSPILIFSAGILAVSQFLGGIQIALKQPKQNGFSTVTGAIVNVMLHIGLYKHIGLYAASVSTLVANMIILFLRIVLLRNEFQICIRKRMILICGGFLYFFAASYFHSEMVFNWINLLASVFFFLFVNHNFIKKHINTTYKIIKCRSK